MALYEEMRPVAVRRKQGAAALGWIVVTLLGVLLIWAALAGQGPLPEPANLPDWHGNVAAAP